MLTDLGAMVLLPDAKPAPTTEQNGNRTLVVQPSFELLLLQLDLSTLYSLLPFAQVNQVGVVSRLTLTRESILRGVAAGSSAESILQLLEERSQKGVPQNVAYTLNDWARLYKGTTISQVVLLEVTSEAVANEICNAPKLQAFGLRMLGPFAITASHDVNPQELRPALDTIGVAAHISTDNGTAIKAPTDARLFTSGRLR